MRGRCRRSSRPRWRPSRGSTSRWPEPAAPMRACTRSGRSRASSCRAPSPSATCFRALNAKLPEDVRVLSAEVAAPGFNARFSARSKMYRYRISNTRVMSPFQRRFAWHISRDLDLDGDERGRARAAGRARFRVVSGSAEPERANGQNRQRTPTRDHHAHDDPLRLDRRAARGRRAPPDLRGRGHRFLKYMVRAVVGTLVEVGDGRRTPASLRDLLDSRDRAAAGPTAPPTGLYLVRVDYDAAAPVSF